MVKKTTLGKDHRVTMDDVEAPEDDPMIDLRSEEGRAYLALPYRTKQGRLYWSESEMKFVAEHIPSRGVPWGFSRSITPRTCLGAKCLDAAKIGEKNNPVYHRSCWLGHVRVKLCLIAASKEKEQAGDWGILNTAARRYEDAEKGEEGKATKKKRTD